MPALAGDIAHSDRLVVSLLNARSTAPEFLDGETLDAFELRKNLREMAMLNRLPGGIGDSVKAVERLRPAVAPTQARRGDRFGCQARDPGGRGS